jgi:hypothetical protein
VLAWPEGAAVATAGAEVAVVAVDETWGAAIAAAGGGTATAMDGVALEEDEEDGVALPTASGLADAAEEEGAFGAGFVSMPLAPLLLLGFQRAVIGVVLLLALAVEDAEAGEEALAGAAAAAEDDVAAVLAAGFEAVVVAAAPPPPPNFAAAAATPPATLCLDATTVAVGAGAPNLAATAATPPPPPAAAGTAALSPGGTHFAGRDMIRCDVCLQSHIIQQRRATNEHMNAAAGCGVGRSCRRRCNHAFGIPLCRPRPLFVSPRRPVSLWPPLNFPLCCKLALSSPTGDGRNRKQQTTHRSPHARSTSPQQGSGREQHGSVRGAVAEGGDSRWSCLSKCAR